MEVGCLPDAKSKVDGVFFWGNAEGKFAGNVIGIVCRCVHLSLACMSCESDRQTHIK